MPELSKPLQVRPRCTPGEIMGRHRMGEARIGLYAVRSRRRNDFEHLAGIECDVRQ